MPGVTLVLTLVVLQVALLTPAAASIIDAYLGQQQAVSFNLEAAFNAAEVIQFPKDIPAALQHSILKSVPPGFKARLLRLPAGPFIARGQLNVSADEALVVEGSQLGPPSAWISDSSADVTQNHINIGPGALVYIKNVSFVGGGQSVGGPALLAPFPISISPDPESTLLVQDATFLMDNCTVLQQLQELLSESVLQDSSVPWPSIESEPGWLHVWRLQARTNTSIAAAHATFVCSWPPPATLVLGGNTSVSAANLPSSTAIELLPQYNSTLVTVNESGSLISGSSSPTVAALSLADRSTDGQHPLHCATRRVATVPQLLKALVELQAISAQHVVIQLAQNLSLAREDGGSSSEWGAAATQDWLSFGRAVYIYKNVTLIGRHPISERITELDFGLQSVLFYLAPGMPAQLRFQQLTLANQATGPLSAFPRSMFVALIWAVSYNRSDTRQVYVHVRNCSIVLPADNLQYTSYWIGIYSSPFPVVRQQAAWVQENAILGPMQLYTNNTHALFLQKRERPGIVWMNITFTDLAGAQPNRMPDCGVQQLVPGDAMHPYTQVTPVHTAQQLEQYLQAPPTPYLVLLRNITFSRATSTTQPPTSGADAAAAAGGVGGSAAPLVRITSSVTLTGWWNGPTLLDFGCDNQLITLAMPADNSVTLWRLTLGGLGPGAPGKYPPQMVNMTSTLWAFDFSRRQAAIRLLNVTLAVPQPELALIHQVVAADNIVPSLPVNNNSAADPIALLGAVWASATVDWSATNDHTLAVESFAGTGMVSSRMYLTSQLLPDLQQLVTPAPAGLLLPGSTQQGGGAGGGGVSASGVTGSSHGLKAWQIAIIAMGAVGGALLLGLGVHHVVKQRQQQAADLEHGKQHVEATTVPCSSSIGSAGGSGVSSLNSSRSSGSSSSKAASTPQQASQAAAQQLARAGAACTVNFDQMGLAAVVAAAGAAASAAALQNGQQQRAAQQPLQAASPAEPDADIRKLINQQRTRHQQQQQVAAAASFLSPPQQQVVGGGWQPHHPPAAAAAVRGTGRLGSELDGVELQEVLGQGSYGVVYRGRWRGMCVAVKTIMFHDAGPAAGTARQRAVNEAAINTLLSHDCICNMYAYDLRPVVAAGNLPDDRLAAYYRLYIIQEYCDAGSLAAAVDGGVFMLPSTSSCPPAATTEQQQQQQPQQRRNYVAILQVAYDIARGLQYIHSRDIIHGDLSSGNIMLRRQPATPLGIQAKVCDFGLSHFMEGPGHTHISNARQGTPYYMAPEVLGHGLLGREADAFSLGVVLWELVHAQQPPWRDPDQLRAAALAQQQQAPRHTVTAVGLQQGQAGTGAPQEDKPLKSSARTICGQGLIVMGPTTLALTTDDEQSAASTPQAAATAHISTKGCGQQQQQGTTATAMSTQSSVASAVQQPASFLHMMGLLVQPLQLLQACRPEGSFTYPLPPDCPPGYAQLVAACLNPSPKARPCMAQVVGSLQSLLQQHIYSALQQQREHQPQLNPISDSSTESSNTVQQLLGVPAQGLLSAQGPLQLMPAAASVPAAIPTSPAAATAAAASMPAPTTAHVAQLLALPLQQQQLLLQQFDAQLPQAPASLQRQTTEQQLANVVVMLGTNMGTSWRSMGAPAAVAPTNQIDNGSSSAGSYHTVGHQEGYF